MQVNVAVDLPLTDDEVRQIAAILSSSTNGLDEALQPVAAAALQEYIRMFLGQKVFTRGSDILEYRLFLLIRELFRNSVPSEERVCALFQVTTAGARALIRSVLSKYQYDLQPALTESFRATLTNAQQAEEDGDYEVTVNAQSLIDGLNRTLAERNGSLPPIVRKRGTVSTYVIKPSAYELLHSVYLHAE